MHHRILSAAALGLLSAGLLLSAAPAWATGQAVDDDPSGAQAMAQRTNYVDGGLRAEKAGSSPDPASTKPYGCSVKY